MSFGFWIVLLGLCAIIYFSFKKVDEMAKQKVPNKIKKLKSMAEDFDVIEQFEKDNKDIGKKIKTVQKFKK